MRYLSVTTCLQAESQNHPLTRLTRAPVGAIIRVVTDLRIEFCREGDSLWAVDPHKRQRTPMNRSTKRQVAKAACSGRRIVFDFSSLASCPSTKSLCELLYQTRDLIYTIQDIDTLVFLEGLSLPTQRALIRRPRRGVRMVGDVPARGQEAQSASTPMVVCFDAWSRSDNLRADLESLIARDGDRCAWCGCRLSATDRDATLDHVITRAKRGPDALDNYLLACSNCNSTRRAAPAASWLLTCLENGQDVQVRVVLFALRRMRLQPPTRRPLLVSSPVGDPVIA
jgi:5-methylcytosine-specific restriction endonuclease McrA